MQGFALRNVLLTGVVMGVTAALIVWWLERFESDRLHREVRGYLERYDEFREWLAAQPPPVGGDE